MWTHFPFQLSERLEIPVCLKFQQKSLKLKYLLWFFVHPRSSACPQCRDYHPTSHRIYLNFDEKSDSTEELETKIGTLEKDLEHRNIQYQKLRHDSEKKHKLLTARIGELTQVIDELRKDNQALELSASTANSTVNEVSKEKRELTVQLESIAEGSSETLLREQNKILEQKLKHISNELQKEITTSTELVIENMKLKSYVDRTKLNASIGDIKGMSTPAARNRVKTKRIPQSKMTNSLDPCRSVIINNYPPQNIKPPFEDAVVFTAAVMGIVLPIGAIKKVISNKASRKIYVEFSTIDLRSKFIAGKDLLKNNPITNHIGVSEFFDDKIQSLFTYANKKLRGKVFGFIAIKDNTVICKRNLADMDQMEITSLEQVDELLKQT